jgi:hypothetical protein
MGQYHRPVCIEAEEGLDAAGMDSGLKKGEQGFSRPNTPVAARDVPAGESWAFREHRTMTEVLADETTAA